MRVFLELGHFDKHSPTTQERKAPQGKNIRFFRLETLKNCILNENFTHRWPQLGHFFPQIMALFSNFWKRAGETSPPLPPLVTCLMYLHEVAYRLLLIDAKEYYHLFLSCLVTSTSFIFISKHCHQLFSFSTAGIPWLWLV